MTTDRPPTDAQAARRYLAIEAARPLWSIEPGARGPLLTVAAQDRAASMADLQRAALRRLADLAAVSSLPDNDLLTAAGGRPTDWPETPERPPLALIAGREIVRRIGRGLWTLAAGHELTGRLDRTGTLTPEEPTK